MTNRLKFLLAASLLALTGCLGPAAQSLQQDPTAPLSFENARSIYEERTFLTHSLHGTQVEFHSRDGRSFLWYPGNRSALPANWKVEPYLLNSHQVCWQYPSNSRNGLTDIKSKGRFQCTPSSSFNASISEILNGDPFNLASGQIPFRMERGRFSAAELAQRMGKSGASSLNYVFP